MAHKVNQCCPSPHIFLCIAQLVEKLSQGANSTWEIFSSLTCIIQLLCLCRTQSSLKKPLISLVTHGSFCIPGQLQPVSTPSPPSHSQDFQAPLLSSLHSTTKVWAPGKEDPNPRSKLSIQAGGNSQRSCLLLGSPQRNLPSAKKNCLIADFSLCESLHTEKHCLIFQLKKTNKCH